MGRHWMAEHIRVFQRLFQMRPTDRFLDLARSEGFQVEAVQGMWFHDPRNWFVRRTQTWALTYALGTRLSKRWPGMGSGLVVLVSKRRA
jgi:hypothetical protein